MKMRNVSKFIAATMLFCLAALSCTKVAPDPFGEEDEDEVVYSFFIKNGGQYTFADNTVSLMAKTGAVLCVRYEKYAGVFYPLNYGEVEFEITAEPDKSIAKVSAIRTGTLYALEVIGVSPGKTSFSVNATATATGGQILSETFEVKVSEYFQAVDLGLSVRWASCNVGALKPEDYGSYFAWGETVEKDYYNWDEKGDYAWGVYADSKLSFYGMTKYTGPDGDGLVTLEPGDDPASKLMGGKWRTPTMAEVKELVDSKKCEWTWDETRKGCVVKGIATGNTIFFPTSGYYRSHSPGASDTGSFGDFWSSSLDAGNVKQACMLWFGKTDAAYGYDERHIGMPVRAVMEY